MYILGLSYLKIMMLAFMIVFFGSDRTTFASSVDDFTITVTGELSILYNDDFENQKSELSYVVKDVATRKNYKLNFKNKAPKNLKTGMIVSVKGKAKGQDLTISLDESGGDSLETVAPNASLQPASLAPAALTGEQKTLVMVADFKDKSVTCSTPAIADLMFSDPLRMSVNDLYQATSHGELWFSGQVAGPYLLNYSSTGACDVGAWGDAIDAAAKADGVDLSAYTRKVYVMPQNSCPAAGVGTVGGSITRSWIFHCDISDVYAHELGHNLGMHHAATLDSEYGDTTDIMGLSQNKLRQINAAHKEQVGWIPEARIQTLNQSGIYNVSPLGLDPAAALAPQTLKLIKTDTNEHYYLSYRRGTGFDASLSLFRQLDRLSVHRWDGAGKTYLLAMLADGEAFVDTANGITVTQLGHTADYSTAQVELGSTPCSRNPPLVSATPTSQSSRPGTSLHYTLTATNTDSLACNQSNFALTSTLPSGWTGSLTTANLTLSPGQSNSLTLAVASPLATVAGTYGVNVKLADPASANHSASSTVSYVVVPDCVPTTPLVSVSPANQSGFAGTTLNYIVTLTNRDSAGCGISAFSFNRSLSSGWSGTFSNPSLTLSSGQSGTTTLSVNSPLSTLPNVYGLSVTAAAEKDPARAGSATASYTVVATSDSQPPTAPTGLSASAKRTQIQLTWSAASDNIGIAKYSVWRNGVHIGDSATTSYNDTIASGTTTRTYYVLAQDAAGNRSAASNPVSLTLSSNAGGKGKK